MIILKKSLDPLVGALKQLCFGGHGNNGGGGGKDFVLQCGAD